MYDCTSNNWSQWNSNEKLNLLTPNDDYSGRTAPLTSKCCIVYIYSTKTGTEYFKHGTYSPFFFSLQNAVCFVIITYLVPVLFTFYIQSVLKIKKKNNSGAKRLRKNLETVPGKHSIDSLQKTAILGTSQVIRKVLQCEA